MKNRLKTETVKVLSTVKSNLKVSLVPSSLSKDQKKKLCKQVHRSDKYSDDSKI